VVNYGLDYYNNGVASSRLVNRILNGEAVSKIDIDRDKDFYLAINLEAASLMNVKIPDAILSKNPVKFDKITPKK